MSYMLHIRPADRVFLCCVTGSGWSGTAAFIGVTALGTCLGGGGGGGAAAVDRYPGELPTRLVGLCIVTRLLKRKVTT
jgi:hypothetical protein